MPTAERAPVRAAVESAHPRAGEQAGSAAVGTHVAFAQVNFVAQPFRTAAVCPDGVPPREPSWQVSSSSQEPRCRAQGPGVATLCVLPALALA